MSVFVKSLKTFESDITGEPKNYRINNAVWVILKSDFKLSQSEWAEGYGKDEVLYGAKFVTCVLRANGLETTETEVIENTNSVDIMRFITSYQVSMLENESEKKDEEDKSEGK